MRQIILAALLLTIAPVLAQQPPAGQVQRCVPTLEAMTAQIKAQWGEVPVISGTVASNPPATMVLYVNPADSSWTIVMSGPAASCISTSGEGLRTGFSGAPI
jgi:hypothetical protein